tara:strand:- start:932 stop:1420 length:489 start_codon:yes stop_codon:yes gene_type:complete
MIALSALALACVLSPTTLLWSDACAVLRDVEGGIAPYVGVIPFDESLPLNTSSALAAQSASDAAFNAPHMATYEAAATSATATAKDPIRVDGAGVLSVSEALRKIRRRQAVAALQACVARAQSRKRGDFAAALGVEQPIARVVAAYYLSISLLNASETRAGE